jgi:hypothetical protein
MDLQEVTRFFKVTIARIIIFCSIYGILDTELCDNLLHK